MKRPEGFDKPAAETPAPSAASRRQRRPATPRPSKNASTIDSPAQRRPAPSAPAGGQTAPRGSSAAPITSASSNRTSSSNRATPSNRTAVKPRAERAPRLRGREPSPDSLARKQLRQAARARKHAERAELRRFTRRARNRKLVLLSVAGVLASLMALITVAVFSPVLALRTIVVDGTNRIDPAEIQAAVEVHKGTPLALLNFDAITADLSVFPLIRSYVTEIVPPDTLLVHIVERKPIGAVKIDGVFRLVDPAGITIQESAERIEGVPVIEIAGEDTSGPAFAAVTAVLLSLPVDVRTKVQTATATTKDDVSFVLSGVGQRVVWGGASDSTRKAALLATLISITDADKAGEFDVSAPSNGIFRPS